MVQYSRRARPKRGTVRDRYFNVKSGVVLFVLIFCFVKAVEFGSQRNELAKLSRQSVLDAHTARQAREELASAQQQQDRENAGEELDPERVKGPSGSITKRLLAWKPRMFTLDGIISDEEAEYVVAFAKQNLELFDAVNSTYRPSGLVTGWSISPYYDALIYKIAKRLTTVTFIPLENFVNVEILRFGDSNSFLNLHSDLLDEFPWRMESRYTNPIRPGQRIARVMVNVDTKSDASFVFPNAAKLNSEEQPDFNEDSADCSGPVGVRLAGKQSLLLHTITNRGKHEEQTADYKTCPRSGTVSWLLVFSIHAYSLEETR